MNDDIKVIGLGFVNAFLLRAGDGWILIDTGMPGQWEILETKLSAMGGLPDKLRLVIITHGDADHSGNARQLRDKYKVRIAMHAGDVGMVEQEVPLKRRIRPWLYRVAFALMMFKRRLQKHRPDFPRFKPDILLQDGQTLDEYGSAAMLLHLPGHTPGSIGIVTGQGDLLAGDTFTNRRKPGAAMFIENAAELEASLARLANLNIRTVYPGHGKPFFMREYLNTTER